MSRPLWVCLLVAGCFLAPASAVAADEIGLSPDGQRWGTALGEPLFDPDLRWVPGDSAIGGFYVRNQGSSDADLRVAVRDERGDADLSGDLSFAARAGAGPWIELQRRGRAHVLTSSALPVGASVHTELRARFERSSTNQTQRDAVALTFDVTLTDAGTREATRGQQRVDVLAATGAGVQPWMLWLGAALAGSGLALVAGSRHGVEVVDD